VLHEERGGVFPEASTSCRPACYTDPEAEYRALGEEAGLVDMSDREVIAARGADVVNLLHRLGTADLESLSPGKGCGLLFTTPQGRTVERCLALREEEGLSLVCAAGHGEALRSWVARYTFREEARLEPTDPPLRALGLFGPRAVAAAAASTGADLSSLPLAHGIRLEWEGELLTLLRGDPVGGEGVLLLAEERVLPRLWSRLAEGTAPCGERAYEARRIEALVPAEGREITEERNPWELGLYDHISMRKGCYVGQEVVARLRNYEKIRRRLSLLELEADPAAAEGGQLLLEGKAVARLTSAASRPAGDTVALAALPVEALVEGTRYELEGSGAPALFRRAVPPPPEL
jgi:folate-binding protein YgfZ